MPVLINQRIVEGDSEPISVRQTVLTGEVDAEGLANFLVDGGTLDVDINAAADALVLAFAAGFDAIGNADFVELISADVVSAWTLPIDADNFLYADRNPTSGVVTYGSVKNLPPVYGQSYLKAGGAGQNLLHLDGSDAQTSTTDENSLISWGFSGTAQLDTAQKKFGATSLLLDGNSDWLTTDGKHFPADPKGFYWECWIRTNGTASQQGIFGGSSNFHYFIALNSSEELILSLGSGGGWSIANTVQNGGTPAVLNTGQWYHIRFAWDGATYKVYLDGVEEISVTDTTPFTVETNAFSLGNQNNNTWFDGWIDEFKAVYAPYTHGTFTPPTAAYGGLQVDGEHWFDLTKYKMYEWNESGAIWDEKQRVFLGEAVTDGTEVTSVITYALQGRYISDWFVPLVNTNQPLNHNLGVQPLYWPVFQCILERVQHIPRNVHYDGVERGGHSWWELKTNTVTVRPMSAASQCVREGTLANSDRIRILINRGW